MIRQADLCQCPGRVLSVISELPDRVLRVAVVPRHPVMLDKSKELLPILDQSFSQCLCGLGAKGLCRKRLEVFDHSFRVFLQVPTLEAVLVDSFDNLAQECTERAGDQLEFL